MYHHQCAMWWFSCGCYWRSVRIRTSDGTGSHHRVVCAFQCNELQVLRCGAVRCGAVRCGAVRYVLLILFYIQVLWRLFVTVPGSTTDN